MHIQFGDRVKDKVTQIEGIVIGFYRCSTGCDQFVVQQGKVSPEGKLSEGLFMDRHRLEIIKRAEVVIPGQPECPGPWSPPGDAAGSPRPGGLTSFV